MSLGSIGLRRQSEESLLEVGVGLPHAGIDGGLWVRSVCWCKQQGFAAGPSAGLIEPGPPVLGLHGGVYLHMGSGLVAILLV